MRFILYTLLLLFSNSYLLSAQRDSSHMFSRDQFKLGVQLGSNGKLSSFAISGLKYWNIGRKTSAIKLGLGGRIHSVIGKNDLMYTTAPVRLTRERSGFVALFTKKKSENIDTLVLSATQVNSFNLAVALHYKITDNWGVELNTDVVGISLGKRQTANLKYGEQNNAIRKTYATPTLVNSFLFGDNSYGSLNSELIFCYSFRKNFQWKFGASYLFNEYTIENPVLYTNSSATVIGTDRYRLKSLTFAIGLNYIF